MLVPSGLGRQCQSNVTSSFLFLVVRPGAPLVASLLLVAMPFVTSSVLAPSVPNGFSILPNFPRQGGFNKIDSRP